MKSEKAKCLWCGSKKTIRKGKSPCSSRGVQQRHFCKDCLRTFVVDDGFRRMRTKPSIVTMSVDMYLSNLSSRKMRNQLKRHMETKRSHVSVLNWVRKYVVMVSRKVATMKPKLEGRLYVDETFVPCKGQKHVFWCSVDWPTRFINATMYSPNPQSMTDAVVFMGRIEAKLEEPKLIQTDSAHFYPRAFRTVFDERRVRHTMTNAIRDGVHNVRIETLFMKIKDRVQDMRGFKSARSAAIIMAGLVIQHNFIETHSAGFVPCEKADIKLNGDNNRWLDLIRTASYV